MVSRNTPTTSDDEVQKSSSQSRTWGEFWDSLTTDQLMEWYNQDEGILKVFESLKAEREVAKETSDITNDDRSSLHNIIR